MSSPEIDLCGIVHVKVDFLVVLKMYVLVILGFRKVCMNYVICTMCSLLTIYLVYGNPLTVTDDAKIG